MTTTDVRNRREQPQLWTDSARRYAFNRGFGVEQGNYLLPKCG